MTDQTASTTEASSEMKPESGAPGSLVRRLTTDAAWDPAQYAQFGGHRARPFFDLLAQIDAAHPRLVVDLGCGPGELTMALKQRWPDARVVGVDSSAEMLDKARAQDPDHTVEWVLSSAEDWDPTEAGGSIDVLITNATLQWVPSHLKLIPTWLEALAPGGTFAMQVPSNFQAPSHALMREVAAKQPKAPELGVALARADAVALPETYAALLLDLTSNVNVWQTTYQQVLPLPAPEQAESVDAPTGHDVTEPAAASGSTPSHPVLEWVKGTGLRPVLGLLTEPGELEPFLTEYAAALEQAYPRRAFGVLFPFTRTFAVALMPTR